MTLDEKLESIYEKGLKEVNVILNENSMEKRLNLLKAKDHISNLQKEVSRIIDIYLHGKIITVGTGNNIKTIIEYPTIDKI